MEKGSRDRVDILQHAERHSPDHEAEPDQEVLLDHMPGLARDLQEKGQPPQVVVHQRNRGAVDGDFAAGCTHRNAHVSRGQRRGIVHTVPDHSNTVSPQIGRAWCRVRVEIMVDGVS